MTPLYHNDAHYWCRQLLGLRVFLHCDINTTLASRPGAHPVQDRRNDLSSFERQCTSVSVVILHTLLTCNSSKDSGLLPPSNLQYLPSISLPSANGLFRFPAPTSGTVFHHTWHLHRRWRYSDSVLRHFSFTSLYGLNLLICCLLHRESNDNFYRLLDSMNKNTV